MKRWSKKTTNSSSIELASPRFFMQPGKSRGTEDSGGGGGRLQLLAKEVNQHRQVSCQWCIEEKVVIYDIRSGITSHDWHVNFAHKIKI